MQLLHRIILWFIISIIASLTSKMTDKAIKNRLNIATKEANVVRRKI